MQANLLALFFVPLLFVNMLAIFVGTLLGLSGSIIPIAVFGLSLLYSIGLTVLVLEVAHELSWPRAILACLVGAIVILVAASGGQLLTVLSPHTFYPGM